LFLGKLKKVKCPVILLLNKIDKIKDKQEILNVISEYNSVYNFDEIIPVSARSKEDVKKVIDAVVRRLPYGPKYYPEDMITDSPERVMVAEIVREKALDLLADEIPHGIAVDVEKMKKRDSFRLS
jgi:GTP-binding protein Era